MKEQFRINLNDTVRVKLTRLGKAIYRHRYDQINACTGEETIKPMDPKEDEEGYTPFQLWSFIELYGQHIGLGRPNVIEPLDIVWSVDRVWKKDEVRYTDEDHAWINGKQWISLRRFQEAVGAAQQRGKWIPCSERLPKNEARTYWICTDTGCQCECRWTNVNHFWTKMTTNWHWHFMDIPQYTEVAAWMPLPDPYQEGEQE